MPKKIKPVLALLDDVKELGDELRAEIQRVQEASQTALEAVAPRWQAALKVLESSQALSVQSLNAGIAEARAEAKTYTEECVKSLNDQILPIFDKVDADILSASEVLVAQIQKVDSDAQAMLELEMGALCQKFDQELGDVREEAGSNLEHWAKEAADALVDQRQQLDASTAKLQQRLEENLREAMEANAREHERIVSDQNKVGQKKDERDNVRIAEVYVQIGLLKEALQESTEKAYSNSTQVASDASCGLSKLAEHSKERFEKVEDHAKELSNSVSLVESFTTKRVEWVIQNASKKLRVDWGNSGEKLHTGWFSPKFDAAGCFGLQLELQLLRVTETDLAGQNDLGNLAVFLWACKGSTMVFKLYIGNKSMTLEKTFNGRVPYGTPRLCWLHEQINKDDDTLRIGVEILETIREIEHSIKVPPVPPKCLTDGQLATDAAHAARAANRLALEGSLFFKRHITNRVLDQVHKEVELMRSRMVRKIEWCVKRASAIRECFPKDEAMCSPHFSAAGVERLQFVLYPSGYGTANEGFCSLYIYGPTGATLRCKLSLGKQVREVCHSFDESGACGRTNFCNWASVVDSDNDLVLIRLEIEEAQQDKTAAITHSEVVAGDRRTLGQIEGSDAPIESVVKLTRNPGARRELPGSAGAGLEDQLALPCLWTPQRLGDNFVPDGFKSFDELPRDPSGDPRAKLARCTTPAGVAVDPRSRPGSAVGRPPSAASIRRNASLPACRPRSGIRRSTPIVHS